MSNKDMIQKLTLGVDDIQEVMIDFDGEEVQFRLRPLTSGELSKLQVIEKKPLSIKVNMRNGKSTGSSLRARIPNETPVEVVDCSDVEWYRVRYEGITGWVMAEYLSHTPPGAPQPTYRVRIEGVTWQQYRRILDICPLAEAEIEEG